MLFSIRFCMAFNVKKTCALAKSVTRNDHVIIIRFFILRHRQVDRYEATGVQMTVSEIRINPSLWRYGEITNGSRWLEGW